MFNEKIYIFVLVFIIFQPTYIFEPQEGKGSSKRKDVAIKIWHNQKKRRNGYF